MRLKTAVISVFLIFGFFGPMPAVASQSATSELSIRFDKPGKSNLPAAQRASIRNWLGAKAELDLEQLQCVAFVKLGANKATRNVAKKRASATCNFAKRSSAAVASFEISVANASPGLPVNTVRIASRSSAALPFEYGGFRDLKPKACQITSTGSEWNTVGFPFSSRFGGGSKLANLPLSGKVRVLYIPVDFSNYPDSSDPVGYANQITSRVDSYYRTMSYGKVSFEFTVLPSYIRMSSEAESYGLGSWNQGDYFSYYREALNQAAALYDISGFDAAAVIATPTTPTGVFTPGPAFLTPVITADGPMALGTAAGSFSDPETGFRWLSHELGHLFGWADMYDVSGRDDPAGNRHSRFGYWDMMSMNWVPFSIEINGWYRFQANWLGRGGLYCLSPNKPGKYGIRLNPLDSPTGARVIAVRISQDVALVIDNRRISSYATLGNNFSNQGLLVYEVDGKKSASMAPISIIRKTGMAVDIELSDAAIGDGESISYRNVSIRNVQTTAEGSFVEIVIR